MVVVRYAHFQPPKPPDGVSECGFYLKHNPKSSLHTDHELPNRPICRLYPEETKEPILEIPKNKSTQRKTIAAICGFMELKKAKSTLYLEG
jgi:hypothetical protein